MKRINIAELLKNSPKGMELDCTIYDGVEFMEVDTESDTIILRVGNKFIRRLDKYGQIDNVDCAKYVIFPKGKNTWEGFVPPREFKDGDVLVHTQNQRFVMSIYHKRLAELRIKTHCILWDKDEGLSVNMSICCYPDKTRHATEEEKQKLFKAIKDNGYKWNPETKTLEKLIEPKFKVGDEIVEKNGISCSCIVNNVSSDYYSLKFPNGTGIGVLSFNEQDNWELVPNKFGISTLKHFDKVLVRDYDEQEWNISFFSHYNGMTLYKYKYSCINGAGYAQCIPYRNNEHLTGTTNDCDEYYKTW